MRSSTFAIIFAALCATVVSAAVTPESCLPNSVSCKDNSACCSNFCESTDTENPGHCREHTTIVPTPQQCTHKGLCLTRGDCCGVSECQDGKCT
ncbi:hypothetical protein BV22DRAFT_1028126 [Leucogyrophana mollusca]|uniref:Uncharacterized protein n=1 Tax=Leucogyrophana mollusca TaxID=85980 RepID=A0ACB8BYC4_9AGAM|nr:hypothetical protein BV22DRAFT_1028126 [Leucogyrophana mollusca]